MHSDTSDDDTTRSDDVTDKSQQVKTSKNKKKSYVILGDSNCKRLYIRDRSVKKVSLFGQKLKNVESLTAKVQQLQDDENVKSVIVHLGTNDMRDDTDAVSPKAFFNV